MSRSGRQGHVRRRGRERGSTQAILISDGRIGEAGSCGQHFDGALRDEICEREETLVEGSFLPSVDSHKIEVVEERMLLNLWWLPET